MSNKSELKKQLKEQEKTANQNKKEKLCQQRLEKHIEATRKKLLFKLNNMTPAEREVYISSLVNKIKLIDAEISDKQTQISGIKDKEPLEFDINRDILAVVSYALGGALIGGVGACISKDTLNSFLMLFGGSVVGMSFSWPLLAEWTSRDFSKTINDAKRAIKTNKIEKLASKKVELQRNLETANNEFPGISR